MTPCFKVITLRHSSDKQLGQWCDQHDSKRLHGFQWGFVDSSVNSVDKGKGQGKFCHVREPWVSQKQWEDISVRENTAVETQGLEIHWRVRKPETHLVWLERRSKDEVGVTRNETLIKTSYKVLVLLC